MSKRLVVILCYVLTFAAGTAMGLIAPHPERPHGPFHHSLTDELHLSSDQQKQMEQIWGSLRRSKFHDLDDRRHDASQQRFDAIRKMLTPEQQTQYDAINKNYEKQMADLSQARRQIFEDAQKQTRELLTPEQRTRYDQIIAQRRAMFDSHGGDHHHSHGPSSGDHPGPAPDAGAPHDAPSPSPGDAGSPPPPPQNVPAPPGSVD